MLFKYWSNKVERHEELLAVVHADSITEADTKFAELTGLVPTKLGWIGVTIEFPKTSKLKCLSDISEHLNKFIGKQWTADEIFYANYMNALVSELKKMELTEAEKKELAKY